MLATRVIPCLLLRHRGLVKGIRFKDHAYLGDPINIMKIFNDKQVDEIALLDITATVEGRGPAFDVVETIASEAFMPLCYGGGVRDIDDMKRLFGLGVEKVSINTVAVETPDLISAAATTFGSQSVIVSIDAKRSLFGQYEVVTRSASKRTGLDPVEHARRVERHGAGEILLNCIDRDGTRQGYDLDAVRRVSDAVRIPVIACGGAGTLSDLASVVREGGASAAAAGTLFVMHGPHRAVLVSYPSPAEIKQLFN